MLRTISSDEIAEWAAYYQLDPFGSHRGDLSAAIVASTVWNVNVKPNHRLKPKDFMPTFGEPQKAHTMSPQEIHDQLAIWLTRRPPRG